MELDSLLQSFGNRARRLEPLTRHSSFKIGGPADLWIQVRTLQELVQAVVAVRHARLPMTVLGNGSNVLVLDGGVRGVVIENHCDHTQLESGREHGILYAESGALLSMMANRLARQGWSGLEWAAGIPGTVGGAVVGNAGAHGGCLGDRLIGVNVLDAQGRQSRLQVRELDLSYRSSRFKRDRDTVILSADIALDRQDPHVCVSQVAEFKEHRRRTQPTEQGVGSIFKNPPGNYAGRLIEQAGLKGVRVGGAEISTIHANFFVNKGGAVASDVMDLIYLARQRVRDATGVELELEIEILGESASRH